MITKGWRGYQVYVRRGGMKVYVRRIYDGKVTFTLDYCHGKYYKTEAAAKKVEANLKARVYEEC